MWLWEGPSLLTVLGPPAASAPGSWMHPAKKRPAPLWERAGGSARRLRICWTLLARVWGLGGPHCKARTAVRAPIPGQLTMGSPVLLSQWEGAAAAVAVVAGMVQAAVGLLQ